MVQSHAGAAACTVHMIAGKWATSGGHLFDASCKVLSAESAGCSGRHHPKMFANTVNTTLCTGCRQSLRKAPHKVMKGSMSCFEHTAGHACTDSPTDG